MPDSRSGSSFSCRWTRMSKQTLSGRRALRVLRQLRIKRSPTGRTVDPNDRGRCHQLGIVEGACPHSHWHARWFDRLAIHLRSTCRTETSFHNVPTIGSEPQPGHFPRVAHRFFWKEHVYRGRPAGDPLAVATPTHSSALRLGIDREADVSAKALPRVKHRVSSATALAEGS